MAKRFDHSRPYKIEYNLRPFTNNNGEYLCFMMYSLASRDSEG